MSDPRRINYYLSDYTDEVMPCDGSLQGWADWLAEPRPDDGKPEATPGGTVFDGYSIEVLGDVRVEWRDGAWEAFETIPDGTEAFFMRHYEGCQGWDPDFSANTIRDACDGLEEDDSPLWFACTRDGPASKFLFSVTPEGPRLTVLGAIQ